MTSAQAEPSNAEVMAALDKTHDELVVRKALDDRWRRIVSRLLALGLAAMTLLLLSIAGLSGLAISNRGLLKETRQNGQEIKDCTTPADTTTDCQKRLADSQRPVLKALSDDNLRSSVVVELCVRERAPDIYACSVQKAEELRAAASTVPPG